MALQDIIFHIGEGTGASFVPGNAQDKKVHDATKLQDMYV